MGVHRPWQLVIEPYKLHGVRVEPVHGPGHGALAEVDVVGEEAAGQHEGVASDGSGV